MRVGQNDDGNVLEQIRQQLLRGSHRNGTRLGGPETDVGSKNSGIDYVVLLTVHGSKLLCDLGVPFRCNAKDVLAQALQQVGASEWSKGAARMRNNYHNGILEIMGSLREGKPYGRHTEILTKETKKLVRRNSFHAQLWEGLL